jgi:outer membrane protein OmpA-like peptidoglycan-associated protein
LNRIASTRRTKSGLLMSLGSDTINFDFDKAELRPEERELLSRIAGILLTSSGYRVQVFGHTDDIGTDQYNQTLSERRAVAVRDYLVKAGIDPAIISTKGFGKSNPLVKGTSEADRAKNRRVEIGIIDTVITYQGPVDADSAQ